MLAKRRRELSAGMVLSERIVGSRWWRYEGRLRDVLVALLPAFAC